MGVDDVIAQANTGQAEMKVSDVYQEVLWQVLAESPDRAESDLFIESWRRTCEAGRLLGVVYENSLKGMETREGWERLAAAIEEARGRGAESIVVHVASCDRQKKEFLEEAGWKKEAEISGWFKVGSDCFNLEIYRLRL